MKILLTLDYELFNGKCGGSVTKCLIEPMKKLLPILDTYNAKITLFVDACFLLRLNELKTSTPSLEMDWNMIVSQLKQLSDQGHDVQLHLHPQWLDAAFKDGLWYSNIDTYKLSDIDPQRAKSLFEKGCLLIEQITGKRPIAFRAGDYCAQTYTELSNTMKENGLFVDSSVFRHKKTINQREWFDYSNIPEFFMYRFKFHIDARDDSGDLIEISIPTFKHGKISILKKKKLIKRCGYSNKPWGDGSSSTGGMMEKGIKKILAKLKLYLKPSRFAMSLDGISCAFLLSDYSRAVRNNADYVMIMGHPKTFSPFSLKCYADFLKHVNGESESVTVSKMTSSV